MDKILLVEDNPTLGYVLKEYLTFSGYEVTWAKDGAEGLSFFSKYPFDICVSDIMMPNMDGFEFLRKLREVSKDMPLIFLTAKTFKIDKLKGFDLGADDYITKPVDEEELVARIKAVLKRSQRTEERIETILNIGSFTFHTTNRQLILLGEKVYNISEKEAALLTMLASKKNQLLTREAALKAIWGKNDYFNRRSMDVHITKLRKILGHDSTVQIRNIHGRGYVLEELGK